jgi:hypothetical protein
MFGIHSRRKIKPFPGRVIMRLDDDDADEFRRLSARLLSLSNELARFAARGIESDDVWETRNDIDDVLVAAVSCRKLLVYEINKNY